MQKFPGQGLNPSHSSDNARFLTTRPPENSIWFHFLTLMFFLLWQGMYGIENEVFLSLPCVLNARGLTSVINQKLKDDEVAQLKNSADTLWGIQKDLKDL